MPRARDIAGLILLFAAPSASRATAQAAVPSPLEASSARVAVLPVALYTAQANVQEASDSAASGIATTVLAEKLVELLGNQVIVGPAVAAALDSGDTAALAGDQPCNVIVACARAVATRLHAQWAVMAKVSKTSNLIWLFTAQLVHAPTGRIVLDDSTELKGEPTRMVRVGARIFAERVARAVKHGGVVTDYPAGEPR